ncbi:MAG: hypothetical protein ACYDBQ_08415, partial [Thermoplasmatota archaeon]
MGEARTGAARRVAAASALMAAAAALGVLAGFRLHHPLWQAWLAHAPAADPVSMAGLLVLAVGTWAALPRPSRMAKAATCVAGAGALILGVACIVLQIWRPAAGLPGRGEASLLAFAGAALAVADLRGLRGGRPSQYLALPGLAAGAIYGLAALFGAPPGPGPVGLGPMPLPFSGALFFVSLGLLVVHSDEGLLGHLFARHDLARAVRRYLPVALVAPFATAVLALALRSPGWYNLPFALAVGVVAATLATGAGLAATARALTRIHAQQARTARHLAIQYAVAQTL